MKRILSVSSLFLFAFSSISYASQQRVWIFEFPHRSPCGNPNLPAGTYAIHWQTGASEVEVKISGNGHSVDLPATVAPSAVRDELLTHHEGTAEVVEGFTVKSTSFRPKNPQRPQTRFWISWRELALTAEVRFFAKRRLLPQTLGKPYLVG
jgi:hypothetical protein